MRQPRFSGIEFNAGRAGAAALVVAGSLIGAAAGATFVLGLLKGEGALSALVSACVGLVAFTCVMIVVRTPLTRQAAGERRRFDPVRFIEDANEAAFIIDAAGRIEARNAHFDALVGADPSATDFAAAADVIPAPIVEAMTTAFEHRLDSTGSIECENRIGEWLIVELSYRVFTRQGQEKFAFTMRDLTETRRREIELATLAFQDSLTRLGNRAAVERRLLRLKNDLAEGPEASFAVMLLDLDRFKQVNDLMGHAAGDRLLIEVSTRVSDAIPRNAFLGRTGGDEFVVIAGPRVTEAAAGQIARQIVDAVAQPFSGALQGADVGVSVGVAMAPADGDDTKALLQLADDAMYRAKRAGSGFAFAQTPHRGRSDLKSVA